LTRTRVRIRVFGVVQGVSFRYLGRQRASSLGLAGWIRNCDDGAVEAVAQGPSDAVDQFVAWMRVGPSLAQVQRADVNVEMPEEGLHTFGIR